MSEALTRAGLSLLGALDKKFDPNQRRDDRGRWSEGGGGTPSGQVTEAALQTAYSAISDPRTGARLANVTVGGYGGEWTGERDSEGMRIIGPPKQFGIKADILVGERKVGRVVRIYHVETDTVVLDRTDVDPEFQKRGIAGGLTTAEEDALRATGVSQMEVVAGSEGGQRLIESQGGWESIGGRRYRKRLR